MPGVMPLPLEGIHVGTCPPWWKFLAMTVACNLGVARWGTHGAMHRGQPPNRVALEACIQARNEGRSLAREGNEIIREAARWCPELARRLRTLERD
jgi:ribulose 1,5-bisphosphate carboxylase large subunit (EC 4.1.1.39)